MFDLILRGGRVLDGAGNSDFPADVAVENGRIAAIGRFGEGQAREAVDIAGFTVAPGFIDVHCHSDALAFSPDPLPAKILQGVTTEINGNCGLTPYPLVPGTAHLLRESQAGVFPGLPWDWSGLWGYAERLEERGPVSNVAPLIGHSALRIAAMGFRHGEPTDGELKMMQRLLADALDEGAIGLSSGLSSAPGVYSNTAELVALAQVLRGSGRPYVTHPRSETDGLFGAIDEAIRIGESAGIPVQISHLKAAGRSNHGRAGEVLEAIEAARSRGLEVTGDVYPYDAGSGPLAILLPPWCQEGGQHALEARLADPAARARVDRDIATGLPGWVNLVEAAGWDDIWITSVERRVDYLGRSLRAIAVDMGVEPAESLCAILLEEGGAAMMRLRMMDEADVRAFIAHPLVMIGSDAIITRGRPHPRTWGTYPRVLGHYARDLGVVSLPEAIRKMTGYPSQKFGLYDRGLIRPGMWADLVVFDPLRVIDRASPEDPEQAPTGIPHVLVNGRFAVRDGTYTGARAGKVLRWQAA